MNIICFLVGHRWQCVYKNPYSQYPHSVIRENSKVKDEIEFKVKCYRCAKESWR